MTNGLMMAEVGVDLVIERLENGVVTAILTQYNMRAEAGGACNGELRMRGTYRDNTLTLGGRNGGVSGKCGMRFEAVKEGNNLTGKTSFGFSIHLTK